MAFAFEDLSAAKYKFTSARDYIIESVFPDRDTGLVYAIGSTLATATVNFGRQNFKTTINVTAEQVQQGHYLWMFTYLGPDGGSGQKAAFGVGAGEHGKTVAHIKIDDLNTETPMPDALGSLPQLKLVPDSWLDEMLYKIDGKFNGGSRKITVIHNPAGANDTVNAIQQHAVVVLFDRFDGKLYGVWDGTSTHNKPMTIPINGTTNKWNFFCMIRSDTPTVENNATNFIFEVGDPRKKATVTVGPDMD